MKWLILSKRCHEVHETNWKSCVQRQRQANQWSGYLLTLGNKFRKHSAISRRIRLTSAASSMKRKCVTAKRASEVVLSNQTYYLSSWFLQPQRENGEEAVQLWSRTKLERGSRLCRGYMSDCGKWLYLFRPQFSHLWSGNNNIHSIIMRIIAFSWGIIGSPS